MIFVGPRIPSPKTPGLPRNGFVYGILLRGSVVRFWRCLGWWGINGSTHRKSKTSLSTFNLADFGLSLSVDHPAPTFLDHGLTAELGSSPPKTWGVKAPAVAPSPRSLTRTFGSWEGLGVVGKPHEMDAYEKLRNSWTRFCFFGFAVLTFGSYFRLTEYF